MPEDEKTPVTSRGLNGSAQGSILERLFHSSISDVSPSISLFSGGVAVNKPCSPVKLSDKRGVRGDILGWSSASRRRLREWLLCHRPIINHDAIGITFTIPGPPVSLIQAKALFDDFTKHFCLSHNIGLCWRLEIQKRGSFHWHALASVPQLAADVRGVKSSYSFILMGWLDCLDKLGKVDYISESGVQNNCLRSELAGAWRHSVDIQAAGDSGAWLRYLQDHASKSKQEQCPERCGRHWGVVGRRFFEASECESFLKFDDDASFYRFLRAFQRLCTPVMSHSPSRLRSPAKFADRPFSGASLGWRIRRGGRGRSVWFSRPDTVRRLHSWATITTTSINHPSNKTIQP